MTDMSVHMGHDQQNLLADMGNVPAEDVTARGRSLGIGFYLSVAFIVLIVLAAILAPWLPLKDPEKSYVVAGERPPYAPSWEFWFGTDQLSRDMFSRTIWGARISLTVGFAAIALRHARRRLARHGRRLLPGKVQRGDLVLLRGPAVVPRAGPGDPAHLAARPHAVHDCVHSRHPGRRSCRRCVAGEHHLVRRPRVRDGGAHARRQAPPASSFASCCRTSSFP